MFSSMNMRELSILFLLTDVSPNALLSSVYYTPVGIKCTLSVNINSREEIGR